jgi:hypothetical protein
VGLEGTNELSETLGSDIGGEFEDDCLLGCCVVLRGVYCIHDQGDGSSF